MHLFCENPTSSCPVVLPATYPSPRCDCQDRSTSSTPLHCRVCHLPFDIEGRLRPDSGLRTFCSCFLGESQVLAVCWMPVFYYLPSNNGSAASGRSSSSRLSTESSHSLPSTTGRVSTESSHSVTFTVEPCLRENEDSLQKHCDETPSDGLPKDENLGAESSSSLPSTVDACLEESGDSSRKQCAGETSDDCLPKDAITDSSVAFDNILPRSSPADSSTALNYSSLDSIQDSGVESTCSVLPKDNIEKNGSDPNLLSDEAIQYKDSISLETVIDGTNYSKDVSTELQNIQTPQVEAKNKNETLGSNLSYFDGNEWRTDENSNTRDPVSSEGNNLEESRVISCQSYNQPLWVDCGPQVLMDNGQESIGWVNMNEPFVARSNGSAESGNFSAFNNPNQYCRPRNQILREVKVKQHRPIFLNPNESSLNSSEPRAICFGNGHQIINHSQHRHSNFTTSNNGYGESMNPSNILNMSEPINNNVWWRMNSSESNHGDSAPLNPTGANHVSANVNNSEEPTNSNAAKAPYPFQYNIDMIHHPQSSEAESQQHAINVSGGNELLNSVQVRSVQPNRMTTENQQHRSSRISSVPPGFTPRSNLPSFNVGLVEFEDRTDLIHDLLNKNFNLTMNNDLANLIRNMERRIV